MVQSRHGASTGAVLWFGPASALGTVFAPFLVNITHVPSSFSSYHQSEFSRSSAFWAACYAHNIANMKYNYAVKDLERRQNSLETTSVKLVSELESRYRSDDPNNNWNAIQTAIFDNAATIVESLWKLSDEIMFKYASGFVNEPGSMSQMVGYPAWWLEAVGYSHGPPPPPTQPKCCHPPKHPNNTTTTTNVDETAADGGGGGYATTALTGKAAMRQYLRQKEYVQSAQA